MNDNDTIKALGYCFAVGDCEHCIYADKPCQELMADALDLINRQKSEIERLYKTLGTVQCEQYTNGRNDGIKEFWDRLQKDFPNLFAGKHPCTLSEIDFLVKELAEEQNGNL